MLTLEVLLQRPKTEVPPCPPKLKSLDPNQNVAARLSSLSLPPNTRSLSLSLSFNNKPVGVSFSAIFPFPLFFLNSSISFLFFFFHFHFTHSSGRFHLRTLLNSSLWLRFSLCVNTAGWRPSNIHCLWRWFYFSRIFPFGHWSFHVLSQLLAPSTVDAPTVHSTTITASLFQLSNISQSWRKWIRLSVQEPNMTPSCAGGTSQMRREPKQRPHHMWLMTM